MRKTLLLALVAIPIACGIAFAASPRAIMTWPDLLDRPHPVADKTLHYGPDPLQVVDVWLPKSPGLHRTVLMVHGGCWQTDIADRTIMDWVSDDLRGRGFAVWNIEYRGVDRAGGGYPGTFQDVAEAADAMRGAAAENRLDLTHVVAVGHSAGGHLALWLAARAKLPVPSLLHGGDPLPIAAAISLGGLPDLETAQTPPGDTCGVDAVHKLTGTATSARPDVYADTSPAVIAPPVAAITLVNATRDHIAPPAFATAFAAAMRAKAKTVTLVTVPDEGHVELIAPGSGAWTRIADAIARAFPQ